MARSKGTPRFKSHSTKASDDKEKKVVKDEKTGSIVKKALAKHRKSRVGKEIKEQQNSTNYAIRRLPFNRLCREYAQDYSVDMRWSKEAFEALQTAAEEHLVKVFGDANFIRLAANAKRQSIKPDDVYAAVRIDSRNMDMYFDKIVEKSGSIFERDRNTRDPIRRKLTSRKTYWTEQFNKKMHDLALLDKYGITASKKDETQKTEGSKKKPEEEKEAEDEKDATEEEEEKPKKQKRKVNL